WQAEGPGAVPVTVSGATLEVASFVPLIRGINTMRLMVSDPWLAPAVVTPEQTVLVNGRPKAALVSPSRTFSSLGETVITSGLTLVQVRHAATDPEAEALSYSWLVRDPSSTVVGLTGGGTSSPTFIPAMNGDYTANLGVKDIHQAPQQVTAVSSFYVNGRPKAVMTVLQHVTSSFGETRITTGLTLVRLRGADSTDPDPGESTSLTYQWQHLRPNGTIFGTATTSHSSFTPTLVTGTWKANVLVRDVGSAPAPVTAEVSLLVNGRPLPLITLPAFTPGAGESAPAPNLSTVNLDGGTSTDPDPSDVSGLTYAWTLLDPSSNVTSINNAFTRTPTFAPAASGTYTAQLYVRDPWNAPSEGTATRKIYVNARPISSIGPVTFVSSSFRETKITSGLSIVNFISASSDPDNNLPLSYIWQLRSPTGSLLPLTSPLLRNPSFTPVHSGPHGVSHSVRDSLSIPSANTASVFVDVNARPVSRVSETFVFSAGE
ncbi:MAG: PKD domain-containing protein, partial [Acidimicrobiaceae bacterium]